MLRSIDDAQTAWRPHIRVRLEHPQDLLLELRVFKVRQVDRVAPIGWLRSRRVRTPRTRRCSVIAFPPFLLEEWQVEDFFESLANFTFGRKNVSWAAYRICKRQMLSELTWQLRKIGNNYEEAFVRLDLCNSIGDSYAVPSLYGRLRL